MKKSWTSEEINLLKELWGEERLHTIITKLKRPKISIIKKAKQLDIYDKRQKVYKIWTNEEKQFLIKNYKKIPIKELEKLLNASKNSILKQAQRLNITKSISYWTQEEVFYLKKNWGKRNIKFIAEYLNRTPNGVLVKAYKIGLKNQTIANGEYLTPREIADIIGKSPSVVYTLLKENVIKYKVLYLKKSFRYQISIKNFKKFLIDNPEKWISCFSDMTIIKSYFIKCTFDRENSICNTNIPQWLEEKIVQDTKLYSNRKTINHWTQQEIGLLLSFKERNLPYSYISIRLNRSEDAIKSKVYELNKKKKKEKQ